MNEVYIFDGIRTPFGRHGGALAKIRTDELLAGCIREVVKRAGIDGSLIEDVIAGDTNQAGEDCRNVARNAALLAGLPVTVAGQTVNRLCGSGIAAILDCTRALRCGEGQLMIAAGVESMSRAPWVMSKADAAYARNQEMFDSTIGWRFSNPRFIGQFGGDTMPETADNIARDLGIDREDSDRFALASQQKYARARAAGYFAGELMAVEVPAERRKDPPQLIQDDEHPRADVTLESLTKLKPLQKDGVVTAGNASGINDGAGALLIGTKEMGEKLGLKPRARVVVGAVAGVEPRVMGLGPVPASQKVLQRAGLLLKDINVLELNEAFATQVLGCLKMLQIPFDDARINPNGGAIAIGHPLGASGIRLVLTALRQLEASKGRYALCTMCIGLGQGIAVVLERVS
ncbi:MAG: beta-ketoadipyl CoA thiolase [Gammaproteobacteria bacterium RIFCSPLOWO2_02_FULL_61_13]|nr:MAG: beta-ketoadipyl CoA thiolase [Gammaproteobacteria bacterium RIFCSPLOWO2_02_FULL_61_13]